MNRSKTIHNINENNFSIFLEDYIGEDDSENSLLSDQNIITNVDEDTSSSNEYPTIESIFMPQKRILPIDIDTYRIIYTYLHKRLPSNLCHIITDYVSRCVIV
jgi:hypothetical protein